MNVQSTCHSGKSPRSVPTSRKSPITIASPEHRVLFEVRTGKIELVCDGRLVTRRRHDKMEVRGPVRMTAEQVEQSAYRSVVRIEQLVEPQWCAFRVQLRAQRWFESS